MSMNIHDQLTATQERLDTLAKLVQNAPDLFEQGSPNIAQVDPALARVYLHATIERSPVDWLALATKYRRANWKRRLSPACAGRYDWDGVLDGVEVSILGAEACLDASPLFATAEAAA